MVKVTCAIPSGFLSRVPAKITSSMRVPRRLFALCSPSTQLMASLRFDFPQPFGPDHRGYPRTVKSHVGPVVKRLKALDVDAF